MKTRFFSGMGLALLLMATACGSSDPTVDPGTGGTAGGAPDAGQPPLADAGERESFLPWQEGNSWTYQVTDDGQTFSKVTTVGPVETVGGAGPNKAERANRVVTEKGDDQTLSWQVAEGDRVLRYREQSFSVSTGDLALEEHWDPYKIHFDGSPEHTRSGASWLESYDETKLPVGGMPQTASVNDRWTILSVDQSVTVPAGTFRTVVVQKVSSSGSIKTYYYARGVGKVKEEGSQVEELSSYEVAP